MYPERCLLCLLFWILFTLFSIISVFFTINSWCFLLRCFLFNFKNCFFCCCIFSSFYRNFIFIRFFFFCPFFCFWKIALKVFFHKTPLVLILVFLATLVFYVRLALFISLIRALFLSLLFFLPSFLSTPGGRRRELCNF